MHDRLQSGESPPLRCKCDTATQYGWAIPELRRSIGCVVSTLRYGHGLLRASVLWDPKGVARPYRGHGFRFRFALHTQQYCGS